MSKPYMDCNLNEKECYRHGYCIGHELPDPPTKGVVDAEAKSIIATINNQVYTFAPGTQSEQEIVDRIKALLKAQLASLLAEARHYEAPLGEAVPANIIKQKMGELDA